MNPDIQSTESVTLIQLCTKNYSSMEGNMFSFALKIQGILLNGGQYSFCQGFSFKSGKQLSIFAYQVVDRKIFVKYIKIKLTFPLFPYLAFRMVNKVLFLAHVE